MSGVPRYKKKSNIVINNDVVKQFKKKFPEYKSVPYKKFTEMLQEFGEQFCELVINEYNGVELPEALGVVVIASCGNPQNTVVDRHKYNNGKNVVYNNILTDGRLMKIFYLSNAVKYKMRYGKIWKFTMLQRFRRKASENFKENYTRYVQLEKNIIPNSMYKKKKKKTNVMDISYVKESYNQFDI